MIGTLLDNFQVSKQVAKQSDQFPVLYEKLMIPRL